MADAGVSIFDYPSARATDQFDRMAVAWESLCEMAERLAAAAEFFEEVTGVACPPAPSLTLTVTRTPVHDLPMEAELR